MEIKQLNGYKIEFYSEGEWKISKTEYSASIKLTSMSRYLGGDSNKIPHAGLVSEISEELVEKIVEGRYRNGLYPDYTVEEPDECMIYRISTAKESFQTLSDLEYCVITKLDDKEG